MINPRTGAVKRNRSDLEITPKYPPPPKYGVATGDVQEITPKYPPEYYNAATDSYASEDLSHSGHEGDAEETGEEEDVEDDAEEEDELGYDVDETVKEDMRKLEESFRGISRQYRLVDRIGEGTVYHSTALRNSN